ncbi:MAG: TonB family protein [Rhodanobacter sp.]
MSALPVMLASVRVVGWTLLHSVWQGALLGLLYAVARTLLPRGEGRYRFGMAILLALALCPVLTLWRLLEAVPLVMPTATFMVTPALNGVGAAVGTTPWGWGAGLNALLPWLVLAWLLGVLLLSLRAWRQWRGLKALVRMAELMPQWQRHATAMAERFGLRRHVTVLCSKVIATPAVVGWVRPVILLPLAVVCNFPAAQIELILAHELAHLRRWDPLANLFQVVLETLCFYHPVVHWVSREVRNEREICCDELALSIIGGSRREFVTALAELGELRERHASLLLAASGGVLLDRVQHLVLPERASAPIRTPARFVAMLLGTALVALTLQLEWKQSHLQRNLTNAVTQLQSVWISHGLSLAHVDTRWHPVDLALRHAEALRPMEGASRVSDSADAGIVLPVVPAAVLLPRVSSLRVADLTPVRQAGPAVTIAVPQASAESSAEQAPTPILIRQPVYPSAALEHGTEGQVVIEFGLSGDGRVEDPRVVSAQPAGVFDRAAIDALRAWRYALPGTGVTSRRYRQTMAFTLNVGEPGRTNSGLRADRQIQAQARCQIVTGTHICREPDPYINSVVDRPAGS